MAAFTNNHCWCSSINSLKALCERKLQQTDIVSDLSDCTYIEILAVELGRTVSECVYQVRFSSSMCKHAV